MSDLPQTSQLWLYFVLVAGIIVLPGMAMAFVMASALAGGRKAGAAAGLGVWLHKHAHAQAVSSVRQPPRP